MQSVAAILKPAGAGFGLLSLAISADSDDTAGRSRGVIADLIFG